MYKIYVEIQFKVHICTVKKVMVSAFRGDSTPLDRWRFVKKKLAAKSFIPLIINLKFFYINILCSLKGKNI